jgi:hypothetical protein
MPTQSENRGVEAAQGLRQVSDLIGPVGPFPPFPQGAYDDLLHAGPGSRAALSDSAKHFAERTDLPSWEPDTSQSVQLGGEQTNEFALHAIVPMDTAWAAALQGVSTTHVDFGNVTTAYLMRRVLHVGASRFVGKPVWQYTEGLLAIVHSTLPATDASVLTVGSDEIREVLSLTGSAWLGTPFEEAPEKRLVAYPNDLVVWYKQQKMYAPVTHRQPLASPPLDDMFGPTFLGPARWEVLTIGDPQGERPIDVEEKWGSAGVANMLPRDQDPDWPDSRAPTAPDPKDGSVYEDDATGVLMQGENAPDISITDEGGTGHVGVGAQSGAALEYGSCTHYDASDNCKACCTAIMTTGLSGVLGAGIACHVASSVCIPCHVLCGVAELAFSLILVMGNDVCQKNCEKSVKW